MDRIVKESEQIQARKKKCEISNQMLILCDWFCQSPQISVMSFRKYNTRLEDQLQDLDMNIYKMHLLKISDIYTWLNLD